MKANISVDPVWKYMCTQKLSVLLCLKRRDRWKASETCTNVNRNCLPLELLLLRNYFRYACALYKHIECHPTQIQSCFDKKNTNNNNNNARKKHSHYILIYLVATRSTELALINSNKVDSSYLNTAKIHNNILFPCVICKGWNVSELNRWVGRTKVEPLSLLAFLQLKSILLTYL